ncbi:Probable RNA-directed DNA polymerase from transposon BS [Eumeta japonica]|uniref:Probable RNA-directed DNA polymerase from transposon BS n=1 Tax=Eumeta variegata TaxID=151549 RepID=A0A4C1TB72_EUMVA|nr:Probable RNA-directed DNA polymerase from transposon BS [Eumeta japonica]
MVSAAPEEINTPILNSIPNDIVSIDDIDNAIGALTDHITTVVESSSRTVPAKSDRRELPRDVIELIRDKNATLRRAGKYPTCENRSRARTLQHKGLAKALKTEGAVPTPALKRPDSSIAFDDREKAESLADSNENQCSENPHTTWNMLGGWKRRPHHSYPQQALRFIEYISEGFKVKKKTVAVFFDVAKAFDRVWHAGLIHKLYKLELRDRLVLIIHHYISNYHFSFRLYNTYSSMRPIRAGVPQGSTLSPLLYSAYVNDIPHPSTGVQLALLADDTALLS